MKRNPSDRNVFSFTPSEVPGLEAGTIVQNRPAPRHFHETWQISWTRSGSGEYCTITGCLPCTIDAPVLIAPGEVHSATPADPWTIDTLHIPTSHLATALADIGGPRPELASAQFPDGARLTNLLRRVQADITEGEPRLDFDVHFLDLATELVAGSGQTVRFSPSKPASAALRRVREYLEAHAHENPSLATLAKLAGLSPNHLTRAFGQCYGLPPQAFSRHVRLIRARKLLRAGVPIAQVALATGYYDQAHFTREFKKGIGRNPSEIRPRA